MADQTPRRRNLLTLTAAFARVNLAWRFAVVCLVILVGGGLIIGRWVSGEIESGVVHRTGSVTALYVDSVVSPHLAGVNEGAALSADDAAALSRLINETSLGDKIVSFKVWSIEGEVLFATNQAQMGKRYPISDDLEHAINGSVFSHLSRLDESENQLERAVWESLVETYSPSYSPDGSVGSVVEFYQLPDDLQAEIQSSQRRGWAIVGGSTVVMYFLLVGLVASASQTITRQNTGLLAAFQQQATLEQRIRSLNRQLRRAAGTKAQTDEQALQRLMQDLHDGPTQDLSLALLRFEDLQRPSAPSEERESLETLEFAVRHAHTEIRNIMAGMRLPHIEGLGWAETVAKAVHEHGLRTDSVVHFNSVEVASHPTPEQRIGAYRVVQEALSNAAHHAGTKEQWVSLESDGSLLTVRVTDHGKGFDMTAETSRSSRRARLGLQSMRDRTELLGGQFQVSSEIGEGTTVTFRIPLRGGDDYVR